MATEIEFNSEQQGLADIVIVHKIPESPKIDRVASENRAVGIEVVPLKHFLSELHGLYDGALAGAVGPEEQRQRLQLDTNAFSNAFEVFNLVATFGTGSSLVRFCSARWL